MTFIFAGNEQQAEYFARKLSIDSKDWIYLRDRYDLTGMNDKCQVIKCGTYYDRREAYYLEDVLKHMKARVSLYDETNGKLLPLEK